MRVTSFGLVLSAAVLLGVENPQSLFAQTGSSGSSAAERFREADELARRGLYDAAKKAFARVARDFPNEDLGREAAERSKENAFLKVEAIRRKGESTNRVDAIVMGDGYTIDERQQLSFDKQAQQTEEAFERVSPFAEYAGYFNWWRMNLSSAESRLDTPTRNADTVLGGAMSKFSQGQVTVNRDTVRQFIQRYAPFADTALVIVKQGSLGTGGGDVAVFGPGGIATAIHEFGHSFGGLLDEYTSQVELRPHTGGGIRGINLTDSTDLDRCPWRHWIEAGTKGVGFFEGGAGRSRGVWHSTNQGCVMSSAGGSYCVVCREAMVRAIYRYVRPIETSYPEGVDVQLPPDAPAIFSVTAMRPKDHFLSVEWKIDGEPARGRREIAGDDVFEVLRIEPGTLLPGTHRIAATVRDSTRWVLKDDEGLLVQTREWTLAIGKRS